MAISHRYIKRITIPTSSTRKTAAGETVLQSRVVVDDEDDDLDETHADRVGRLIRSLALAQRDASNHYLRLHEESNDEREDGWAKDLFSNLFSAGKKFNRSLENRVHIEVD